MRTATLPDGTRVHCLRKPEALALDRHVHGYLDHGIDVRDDDVVFDVGANIGIFGIRAIQRHAGVRVFAFEPVPAIGEVLYANAALHGAGRLLVMPFGLSQEAGEVAIDYFPNSPALSSAYGDFWDQHPGALPELVRGHVRHARPAVWYARFIPECLSRAIAWNLRRGAQRVRCEVRTVSQVIREQGLDRVDLLKVDCEGAELDVLLGIDDADWPKIGRVVAEVTDLDGRVEAIRALLTRHGFGRITVERECGFETAPLMNIFATREVAAGSVVAAAGMAAS
jgi:FkbM family methyltransferase